MTQGDPQEGYVEIPIWFIVLRMVLILVLFIGMQYLFSTYVRLPSNAQSLNTHRYELITLCPSETTLLDHPRLYNHTLEKIISPIPDIPDVPWYSLTLSL